MELSSFTASLLGGLVGSVVTLGANWCLFRIQFRTKRDDELRREGLEELVLPLYVALEKEEFGFDAVLRSTGDYPPEEWIADAPKRLRKIAKIIERRLYLADGELHKQCLAFLKWLEDNADSEERRQKVMRSTYERGEHPDRGEIERLRKTVRLEYDLRRKQYLA